VLAKANRIVRGADYRMTVRRGARTAGAVTLTYARRTSDERPPRFGFIVAKTVGNAVTRNRVRRRLKAIAYEAVPGLAPGTDVVVRALPAAAQAPWTTLQEDIHRAVDRVGAR
jgi:ribonuclease P protein component, eubacterial